MKKIIVFLVMATTIFAQKLTLDQAIDLSIKNSKEIKVSSLESSKAKYDVRIAFKKALPSVVYNGQYFRHEFDSPMKKYGKSIDAKGGYVQGITISQPLFMGGTILGGIKYASEYKKVANLSLLAEKRDIRLETIRLYSNIVKNRKNLGVLKSSKEDLDERYKKQKEQLKLRLITKSDLLKTEYNILDLDSKIIAIKNLITVDKERLSIKMGMKSDDIQVVDFEVPKNLSRNIDLEKDLKNAKEKSINALISRAGLRMAEAEKSVARGQMLPKVSAFGTYGVDQERRKFNESYEDATWRGGVQVTWNIFDFGQDYDSYKKADINKEQKILKEKMTQDNISVNLTDAYLNLVKMEKERSSRKRALEAATEDYKMDSQKYTAGLISTIDFLNSQTKLRDAKTKYNEIVVDYLYAFEKYRSILI